MKRLWILLATAFFLSSVQAQNFPAKPLRIIVPFPAGGIVDLMARTLNEKLAAGLGQPVLVEARPGANASLGTEAVAKSEPDGHTLVLATLSHVTTPALMQTPWHPLKDFAGVAMMGHVANIAVVNPEVPAKTLREFVDYAKTRPGKVNFINAGAGTSQTMSAELFRRNAGLDMVGIGYKGFPPAVPDILAGQVQFSFFPFGVAAPHIASGKLRALAIAAPARSRQFPDLPTMAEAGFADSQVVSWYAFLVPAATPKAIVARLNAEFAKALADPEVIARIQKIGGEPLPAGKPEEVDAMLAREFGRWTKLVQATGMKIQ
ncbi:MAG TPA: tripartite tricarboxylate transporter substrate binding protein [Burkholderiales bacterium]|jgi:tripartite-type tricarboxylate transporter receptor subunit TctC|nr:tripartite tricarboxylate transporter substrate binding protein [Burkholderiales bacterium]